MDLNLLFVDAKRRPDTTQTQLMNEFVKLLSDINWNMKVLWAIAAQCRCRQMTDVEDGRGSEERLGQEKKNREASEESERSTFHVTRNAHTSIRGTAHAEGEKDG